MPSLPVCRIGSPPSAPPGASRPAPRLGGMRGVGVPPEIRRRTPGASKAAPSAARVAEQVRLALGKAQMKLLGAKAKLQLSAESLRGKLRR